MKHEKLIPILILTLLLTACDASSGSFSMETYGECFSTENAVFCVASDEICAYDLNGEKLFSEENHVTDPVCCMSGNYAVVYGAHDIFLSDSKNVRHNYVNNKIMSTAINESGYFSVCTEEAGYKGAVTVYDENFVPVYKCYSASGIIIKAALSEKNILAVLTANESGSTAHLFSLGSEEEQYSVTVPKTLCIDLNFVGERLCLLSETAAYFVDGEKISDRVTFDRTLGEYALTNEFAFFELLNGDGTSELICLDSKGKRQGSAECEMLRGIAANENAVAVLCGSDAVLFDENLKEICRGDAKGVRSVLLCGDNMLLQRDGNIIAYK